jgi:dienelactone hydrolase
MPTSKGGNWLAFGINSSDNLVLKNISNGDERVYNSVRKYTFSEDGRLMILEKEEHRNNDTIQSISLIELSNLKASSIWSGRGLKQLLYDKSATKIAFLVSGMDERSSAIWYYGKGALKAVLVADRKSIGLDTNLIIGSLSGINNDGNFLFFTARKIENKLSDSISLSTVNIWSYLDEKLQTAQVVDGEHAPVYSFVLSLRDFSTKRLDNDNEWILAQDTSDSLYLVQHISGSADEGDSKWNSASQFAYYLRSVKLKDDLALRFGKSNIIGLSPKGRFVIYYDKGEESYFSYEVATGHYRNLTSRVKVSWINYFREDLMHVPRGIAGWLENDASVLIYDKFDIWKIDPLNMELPVNLTNGYGLKKNIIFYLGLSYLSLPSFRNGDILVLNAVNVTTKENGFFRKILGDTGDPKELTMGDYIYQLVDNPYTENNGSYPIKARDRDVYIVSRMKANESPNYFSTSDFKTFVQLSSIYPEKHYNWYTTELHTWRKEDGANAQGILYKPEDFDSSKKYPIIFYYYEKKSFSLNAYLLPENISGFCNINIPTFVSNGYLVFLPDIDYVIGDPMQGTFDAVVSAANYLSNMAYVDKHKMGIGGCSFGGLQTNYLVTHTNLFAAAYSSCSMSDLVSAYGDVPARYKSLQSYFELGQGRMGGTLWQIPEAYIKSSAVFSANKVTTPLLLMQNTNDGICSFSQAVEFFTALRRLGKRAWLLEYTDGNHGVFGKSADDYSIRLNQFFDHYLKDKPAPNWMTRGVPAKMKGRDSGYHLDYNIKTPGKGLLKEASDVEY